MHLLLRLERRDSAAFVPWLYPGTIHQQFDAFFGDFIVTANQIDAIHDLSVST